MQAATSVAYADALAKVGSARIWTRLAAACFFDSRLTEGIPVLAKDFSQSCVEGPRIFPSMYARPGQREQVVACVQLEQPVKSFTRIERTSFS